MAQEEITATRSPDLLLSRSPRTRLAAGLLLCLLIAALALLAGHWAPLVGAPIFAIALGVLIANTLQAAVAAYLAPDRGGRQELSQGRHRSDGRQPRSRGHPASR